MRIATFHATLPQPGQKPGGVSVFVDRLADRLARRGHEVTVASFSPAPPGRRYRHMRLRPHRFAHARLARLALVPVLLHRLNRLDVDVIHLHGDDWFYLRRARPTVRTFYGSALSEAVHATRWKARANYWATYPLETMASHAATAVYGIGPDSACLYRATGILPLAVDRSDANGTAREARPTVLFVGTWGDRKRGALLHEVFRRDVLPALPDARLWMVSDRCEPAEGVEWFPAPSDAELADLYARAWVFCSPSTYEGFGIPYIEAMAHATPVIASLNPGSQMILEGGRHGMIVEDEALGPAVARVLGDEGLRGRLGAAAWARSQDFAWERALDAHERAYRLAIARWGARA
jgi:glycosyltransferase involved in cell wall biosynthesis